MNSLNASLFQVFAENEEMSAEENEFEVQKSLICGILATGENPEAPIGIDNLQTLIQD